MSNTDGTCEYVLDPDDPETWGGEEGDECYVDNSNLNEESMWECPHDTAEKDDLCLFHQPHKNKDDTEVANAFLDLLINSERGRIQLIGAQFGRLDLSENPIEVNKKNLTINLTHAKFDNAVFLPDSVFDIDSIDLQGARFTDFVDFRNVQFGKSTDFGYVVFQDAAIFRGAKFEGENRFELAKFQKGADFSRTNFGDDSNFVFSEFDEDTSFEKVDFDNNISFDGAIFRDSIDFEQGEFFGHASFQRTVFRGEINFADARFEREANFGNSTLTNAVFTRADLTDVNFNNTNLCKANLESALLSRAKLFGTDLRGARIFGVVLGDVRIDDDTQLLGYPFDDNDTSPHTISAIRSIPYCVYDPDYKKNNGWGNIDKAKSVYRALEELGRRTARPQLQTRAFVRRQDLQKDEYEHDMVEAWETGSWEQWLIAGIRYRLATVARATLLYGESPWRVIAWSLGIIFSFALLYPLGGWMKPADGNPITYAQIASNPVEILNSVYYSTLTYTALGFGDFQPVGLGRLLTTLETGLGAVMLALLVFILGRRAAR